LQYDLKTARIDAEHAQALLRQEIADVTARYAEAERNTKGLEASLSESRNELQKAQVECTARVMELQDVRASMQAIKEIHRTACQDLEKELENKVTEEKAKLTKVTQELISTNDQTRKLIEETYQDEKTASFRQMETLTLRMHETEAAVLAKDREIKELMDAIEELEQEKRTEILSIETQRQVERKKLLQQQKERIGQVECRYQSISVVCAEVCKLS
jgi:hypothetical protein